MEGCGRPCPLRLVPGRRRLRGVHDTEWGFPVRDDRRLFEKISLEGFQTGLSWLTILRKRENFRRAFADFAARRVARFTRRDVTRLLKDAGIVRHRGKIESTINNAKRCADLVDEFGTLADCVWHFEPDPKSRPRKLTRDRLKAMPTTPESVALSKDLRKRGWSFVGPTTMYAFMQAMGLVNDHLHGCEFRGAADLDSARDRECLTKSPCPAGDRPTTAAFVRLVLFTSKVIGVWTM